MRDVAICACCGQVLGEIEGGKLIPVSIRGAHKMLKEYDYIGICGDCMINAEPDDDSKVLEIRTDGGRIA